MHLSSKRNIVGTLALATLCVASCSGDDAAGPCDNNILTNTVAASSWATKLAQIASYRYAADLQAGVTTVELLDAGGQLLDTMKVWQSFGDQKVADGAMVAELGGLRLVTRGLDIDARGYRVRATISGEGKPTLITNARFESARCYPGQPDGAAAPPCAGDLPLDSPSFTLPSCGIVTDAYLLGDSPATLTALDYALPASEAKGTPASGGFARTQADGDLYTLVVRDVAGLAKAEDVQAWIEAAGLDAVLGGDAELRLTTAYLDRSWWREVEKHVGFCSQTFTETTASTSQGLGVTRQAQSSCAGGQSAKDWNEGGSGSDSSGNNVWGDPHLTTLDGHKYNIQSAGEFVLMETTAGDPIEVHARFQPFENPKVSVDACKRVTLATAVATELDGHKVSVHARPNALYIDGKAIATLKDLPTLTKGEVLIDDATVTIVWPGGERMKVARSGYLTITITLPAGRRGQVTGLLGNFNGNDGDDFRLRSGEPLPTPLPFDTMHGAYADSWRVLESESLLHYLKDEKTATFTNYAIPGRPVSLDDVPAADRTAAEAICADKKVSDPRALSDCILDVVCAPEGDADGLAQAAAGASPESGARPGDDALAAGGDALSVTTPASAVGEKPADPTDKCQAPARRWLLAFAEKAGHTLAADLAVDIVGPGGWQDPTALPGGSVLKDTAVDSFLVHRNPDGAEAAPLEGWVKFARKIVGVIVVGAKLDATDGDLGASGTTYASGSTRGIEKGDAIVIEGDTKTLQLRFSGEDVDHVRVLTEAK